MKKTSWLLILLFIPVVAYGFFAKRLPIPLPDVYTVKLKNLTYFDLISKDLDMLRWNQAELTESKPEDLEVDVGDLNFNEVRYGCFRFGNRGQRTWFFMGKDSDGYWSDLYIDQNLDYRIEKKEKIKGLQTGTDSVRGIRRMEAFSLVPVPITVSYKGVTAEFERNLYFFIKTGIYQKNDSADSIVVAITASFLEGEFSIRDKGNLGLVKFRIIDINGNGCFNDYGIDLLSMDLNRDGYFRKNESDKLAEYPYSSDKKQRWRVIVPPFPANIAIADVVSEIDPVTLEPLPSHEGPQQEPSAVPIPEE
jgi:hypothetical protein